MATINAHCTIVRHLLTHAAPSLVLVEKEAAG